jgi:CRP/FNR family transcriptional regulator, cyclic AMP receptor protein
MFDEIPLFQDLSETDKSTISLFSQERRIRAGEVLFNEGDDAIAMYVVKSGTLKAYRDRSSWEQALGYDGPGEIVGEMALFDKDAPKTRLASVRAVEDTLLIVIADYAIVELGEKYPAVYERIWWIIRDRQIKNGWL